MTENSSLVGKKVLLIEDDRFFAKLISKRFIEAQCIVTHFFTGEEGLSDIEKNPPDVVLLDLLLPGKFDGFAVLEKIKTDERFKKIPVVILSNLSRPQDIERCMGLGAFRYIIKSSIIPADVVPLIQGVFTSGR
jgi:CheY-like chemotaxis protein